MSEPIPTPRSQAIMNLLGALLDAKERDHFYAARDGIRNGVESLETECTRLRTALEGLLSSYSKAGNNPPSYRFAGITFHYRNGEITEDEYQAAHKLLAELDSQQKYP